jgi:hypothetical protein
MAFLNRSQFILVLLGLMVLVLGFVECVQAETLIYSNTNLTGYKVFLDYGETFIDYGTSVGGKITKFTIGYETTYSDPYPGNMRIRFYKNTNSSTVGSCVRTIELNDLPGGWPYFFFYEYELPEEQIFYLPEGYFGYSFTVFSDTAGILLASGGSGNVGLVWMRDDENEWETDDFYGHYAGFFMEVYEGDIPDPPTIRGYKFNDIDGDGSWDDGEPTMPGWEMFLDLNDNGIFDYGEPNSVTDPNGLYELEAEDPGAYTVAEVLQDGWTQTCPGGDGTYSVVADVNEVYTLHFGNCEGLVMAGLSGYVLTDEEEPVEDVLISTSTGQSTMTDEYGYYELALPAPWSGTITPSKECFTFDPAVYGYSNLNTDIPDQDFTAIPICFYGGGFGTEGDPYLIYTAEHMQEIGTHPEHWIFYFRLMNDIDMAGYTGESYNIIGYYENSVDNEPFSGVFDGNGHKIYNFIYSSSVALYNVGVFGYVSGLSAEIRDLTLVEPQVTVPSGTVVGSLAGWISQGTISRCGVTGGLVSANNAVGGLVGQVGFLGQGILDQCYTKCEVIGNNDVGGLAGWVFEGTILDCYSTSSVLGSDTVGGLIGDCEDQVSNCYCVADVSGSADCGAFIGKNSGAASSCFWNADINSSLPGVGTGDSGGVIGVTTENMQAETTFTDEGWDFTTIWDICDGTNYPKFLWYELPIGDLVCPDGVEVADFAIISASWLQTDCGDCGGADLSGDSDVGLPDVEIFVDNWMMGVGI